MLTPQQEGDATNLTLGIVAAVIAITCCAGLPLIGALLAGLTLARILGLGFGAVLLGALAWISTAIFTRKRHRRRCDRTSEQP